MTKTSVWMGFSVPVRPNINALQATHHCSLPAVIFSTLSPLTSIMKLKPYTSPHSKCKVISNDASLMEGSLTFTKTTAKEMEPDDIDAKENLEWNNDVWNDDED